MPWFTGISEGAPAAFAEDCTTQSQDGLNLRESVVIRIDQGVRLHAQASGVQTSVSASQQNLEGGVQMRSV